MSRDLFRLNKKFLLDVVINTRLFLCKRIKEIVNLSLFTVSHFSVMILTVKLSILGHVT